MNYNERKIRILLGVNNFCVAGAQKLVADYLNNFDEKKYDLALLTFFQHEREANLFDLLPSHVRNYKLNFGNFYDLKNWFLAYKILQEFKPDFVLSHLFFSNTVLRILKPFFGYKVIIYEHNIYRNKTQLKILTDKLLAHLTHKIIADSESVKKFTIIQEKISPEKFAVIPCAINYRDIQSQIGKYHKEELKKLLGFAPQDRFILNAARLVQQKNHRLLIDSFAEFNKKNSSYKLVILGSGPFLHRLNEQVKKLNLENKVLLLGQKRNVLEYMLVADFLVMTSIVEGFPIVCLEALAVGLPVVATQVAGLDGAIINGHNGYLAEKDTPESIAAAMAMMAEAAPGFFRQNCQATAQKYDIVRVIEQLTKVMFSS